MSQNGYDRNGRYNYAKAFLGTGWKFPPAVDKTTGKILTSSYEEDIEEAVRIILFTGKGERMMRPEFGSALPEYMFETMDSANLYRLEQDLTEALIRWEPRIVSPVVTADAQDMAEGILRICVSYTVRSTNNPYNLVFPYYITEGV